MSTSRASVPRRPRPRPCPRPRPHSQRLHDVTDRGEWNISSLMCDASGLTGNRATCWQLTGRDGEGPVVGEFRLKFRGSEWTSWLPYSIDAGERQEEEQFNIVRPVFFFPSFLSFLPSLQGYGFRQIASTHKIHTDTHTPTHTWVGLFEEKTEQTVVCRGLGPSKSTAAVLYTPQDTYNQCLFAHNSFYCSRGHSRSRASKTIWKRPCWDWKASKTARCPELQQASRGNICGRLRSWR